jgi:hypothetical protein
VKRLAYLILTATVLAAIGYCVYFYRVPLGLVSSVGSGPATDSSSSTLTPSPSTVPYAGTSWQIVERSADGFRVDMPGEPTLSQLPSYTSRGEMEPVNMLQATRAPNETFAVTWADSPPVQRAAKENAEKTLDLARDGALARTQTRLTAEINTIHLGYPARDFASRSADGGMMQARMILAGSRLYMLIVSFPQASPDRDEEMNRFFNSFTLTN